MYSNQQTLDRRETSEERLSANQALWFKAGAVGGNRITLIVAVTVLGV